jgi:uncharacterized protein YhdP
MTRLDSYKESITKTIEEKLNRDVAYETVTASLSLRDGLFLRLTNVVITEKDRSSAFMNVKNIFLRVKLIPLLWNHLVFREVVLNQPGISLTRYSNGELNIADLLTRKKDDTAPEIRKLVIEKGKVTFLDEAAGGQALLTSLDNLSCRIASPFWTKRSHFHIKTSVIEEKNMAGLELDGSYRPAPSDKSVYESTVKTSIKLKGMDVKHYRSYLKKYTPVEQIAGHLNMDMTFSGKFSDFKSKGTITIKNVRFDYPDVFRDTLQPRMIQLDYALKRDAGSIKLDVSRVAVDKFEAKGSFAMDDLDKKDPLLEASATTAVFLLKEVRSYIPWGIIPKGVGNFIDTHVKDGHFRLVEGKLEGRLSQIKNMNKKENADVLSIEGEVNKGVFEAHPTAPLFHDINGILELKKRQFALKDIKARFGLSPLTMEGSISDFASHHPNIYTAEMKIQPVRDEIIWLLGKEKFREFGFKGPSNLVLSGKGTNVDYHINAQWDLTGAAYAYPGVMEKPGARKNQLNAELIISEDAVNLSSFNYDLPPANITGSMMVRFAGGIPSSFNIKAKALDAREAAAILPVLRKFNPAGTCALALAGSGDLNDPGSLQWKGNISLFNVSLTPSSNVKPMKGLTGNAFFKGNMMETSLLKAQMGESNIQGQLKIDDFRNPKVAFQFNTNLLKTNDLGLQSTEGEVNLRDVKGQMTIEDKLLHIDNLSFKLGQSGFNLTGDITDLALPKVTLALNSPYVSSDDLSRIISLSPSKKEGSAPSAMELNATLRLDAGKFGDIDFKKLNAGLKYSQSIIDVETLEAGAFEGKFKAKGRVAIHPRDRKSVV